MSTVARDVMSNYGRHVDHVGTMVASYLSAPPGQGVRLAKPTTNLFRQRRQAGAYIDATALTHVISIDTQARTADVEAMCTYEDLVSVTLHHGLMPSVVPQLRTITVGGAATGLGIESTSFQAGLPHEAVLDADIMCADGVVRRAQPGGENDRLWRAFAGSYGTLGYATRLRLQLVEVKSFVHLHHLRFSSVSDAAAAIAQICESRSWQGAAVDFLDGVVFSPTEVYLTLGRQLSKPEAQGTGLRPSTYTGQDIYYQSIRHQRWDLMRIDHYLWRWDTDWFWCSRAFGAQNPWVRRVWPARLRRSDVYRRLLALDDHWKLSARAGAMAGRPPREKVIQDIEVPVEQLAPFMDWFDREVGMSPVWLCPVRLAGLPASGSSAPAHTATSDTATVDDVPWPLYPLRMGTTYVNVGFWGTVPVAPDAQPGHVNRAVERQVTALGGLKSLYSTSYYDEAEFAQLYGGPTYLAAKEEFDPQGRLGNLYDKAVNRA